MTAEIKDLRLDFSELSFESVTLQNRVGAVVCNELNDERIDGMLWIATCQLPDQDCHLTYLLVHVSFVIGDPVIGQIEIYLQLASSFLHLLTQAAIPSHSDVSLLA